RDNDNSSRSTVGHSKGQLQVTQRVNCGSPDGSTVKSPGLTNRQTDKSILS
ncbi:914_t:CDS:1, partial [Scutellospora calospora]